MRVDKSKWKVADADFGPLLPYIQDENVTDINYNGSQVWIDDLTKKRYCADIKLSKSFIERFTARVADAVSATFNQYHPLLEAETETLRISIVHEEYANTGRSISIRKTPVIRRLNKEKMIAEQYCSEEFLSFIENCVHAKMNMLMCGLPGTGKTEFLKYLTSFIPAEDRVITIEDIREIHYSEINPGKDCVEMKVEGNESENPRFTYITAIKACLRQNPQWILLSEARSTEVKYLMESMSTGTHCLTTIHTDDVRKVPDRIKNMVQDSVIAARIENDTYMFLDAAILVKKKTIDGIVRRYIDQMCFFSREDGKNELIMVVEDGKIVNTELPRQIMRKFEQGGIDKPFAIDLPQEVEETAPSPNEPVTSSDKIVISEPDSEDHSSVVSQQDVDTEGYIGKDEPTSEVSPKSEANPSPEDEREIGAAAESDPSSDADAEANNVSAQEQGEDSGENSDDSSAAANATSNNIYKGDYIDDDDDSNDLPGYYFTANVVSYTYDDHKKDDEARLRRAKNRRGR